MSEKIEENAPVANQSPIKYFISGGFGGNIINSLMNDLHSHEKGQFLIKN